MWPPSRSGTRRQAQTETTLMSTEPHWLYRPTWTSLPTAAALLWLLTPGPASAASSASLMAALGPGPAAPPSQPGAPQGATPPASAAGAPGGGAGLSQALANPISSLFVYPFQNNFTWGAGPQDEGFRYLLNFQPVMPFRLDDDWNLIVRTVIPLVSQHDLLPIPGRQYGLSDTLQSFFLSPAKPTRGNITWGAGPALQYPTATSPLLGSQKWAAGPTGVVLRVKGPWTYGLLANHLFSYAGNSDRADVNQTFFQPFVAYTLQKRPLKGVTLSANNQSVYNWEAREWALIQAQLGASKVYNVGGQLVQLALAGLVQPEIAFGGSAWGVQFTVAFVYPRLPQRPRRPAGGGAGEPRESGPAPRDSPAAGS